VATVSLIRVDPERLRGIAEKIRRDADRLAPRDDVRSGRLHASVVPILPPPPPPPAPGRLTVSAQEPLDAKPGDSWINSMTGEHHVFCAFGVTAEEAGIRMKAALGGCQHANPEPVILTTDEVVAAVCPDCLQPLPPSFVGSTWKP
jgi:hypothetical protein